MRRRRAERCVLRAEEALAAGHDADAREALDEARGLAPSETPTFEELRARVAGRTVIVAPSAPERRRMRWPAAVAMLALTATLVGVGVYSQLRVPAIERSVATTAPTETRANRGEASPGSPAAMISHETVRALPTAPGEVVGPGAEPGQTTDPATVGPVGVSLVSNPLPVPTSGQDGLPTVMAEAPALVVAPPPPEPPPVPAEMPRAGSGAPLESLAASAAASAPVVPVTEAPAAAPEPVAAEPRIRAVLSAYEAAFTSLDASAARSVWPNVDQRALSRAFNGLASQSVSLGECEINVQGDAATARCTGNATWAPKVGGVARTAARRWQFALEKAGSTWQIVRADVR
jgi:hypothetical protein